MIELTVGLPMYRSREIAWLALESLCRQKDIDFKWELLIIEEEEECFGQEKVKEYVSRLKENGCTRLEYISLKQWIPLSLKWKQLANMSSDSSKCFLLQAADCYAQPYRLKETNDIFKKDKNIDWVQSKNGFFYDITNKKSAIFDHNLCRISHIPDHSLHPCSLNMAIKTNLIKRLSPQHVRRSVDSFLFKNLTSQKGSSLKVEWNHSDNWRLGFDTDGLNNISRDRSRLICGIKPPFVALPKGEQLEKYIPSDILSMLYDCYSAARKNKLIP